MKLQELKERVDQALQSERNKNLEVCIPNNKGGMGGTSTTGVKYAGQGIDWDSSKFFVWPDKEMQEIKSVSGNPCVSSNEATEYANGRVAFANFIEQKWREYRLQTNNEDAWMFKKWLVENNI